MRVPFLDLRRQHVEVRPQIDAAISRVVSSGNFVLGREVALFENEWARFCRVAGAVGVNSGTDGLTLALIAAAQQRKSRQEVITSPVSAGYSALAIKNAGLIPVFADLDPVTYTLSPDAVESAINRRTLAIMPVHLYGQITDMKALCEIAARHRLIMIEDAAHAHGVAPVICKGKTHVHAAAFSFYPTKNLGAAGDGGAVVSNDRRLLDRVRILREGGHTTAIGMNVAGQNSRLDEMQAAILRTKLKRLRAWNTRRRQLASQYRKALAGVPDLVLPADSAAHAYHLFVIQHPERDALRKHLQRRGIETLIHYPFVLHKQKLFEHRTRLPVAEHLVKRILSLPLYPQLLPSEIDAVAEAINGF
ncbi:MAG TPA: DegT/DnrJ/EryC1/StrS family aminotransferase [Pyrinomonadaceae bacterium]|nr:DegT/DnrJ/EryC1/StrS family aminotransferase [Pyrinomonadaceae bacterium]